jgi:hypothetical protein
MPTSDVLIKIDIHIFLHSLMDFPLCTATQCCTLLSLLHSGPSQQLLTANRASTTEIEHGESIADVYVMLVLLEIIADNV